jgi:CP family cyanate transporter-like MFS transporter
MSDEPARREVRVQPSDTPPRSAAPGEAGPALVDELLIGADPQPPIRPPSPASSFGIGLALVFAAFNMRPALTSIAPILPQIRDATGIGAFAVGVLTTVPVLCLGAFGPLAPQLARRLGPEVGILASLAVLAAGLVLRGTGSVTALFAGSILAGAAIAVMGVLLPGIVKRDFSRHAGLVTGVYTMVLCLGAASGAGLTVPAMNGLGAGWAPPLTIWALPAAIAVVVWVWLVRSRPRHVGGRPPDLGRLWRDPLAWAVTGFMGLQSSLAYIVFGWLPVVLQDRGFDPLNAGYLASASTMAQALTALLVPAVAGRARDQRLWALLVIGVAIAGFAGLVLAPLAQALAWAIVLGLGLGGCFGLGLTLIVLRAANAHVAASLSAMAQSVGYCLAATGPFLVGLAYQGSGGWVVPLAVYLALAIGAALCGLKAGRHAFVLGGRG